MKITVNAHGILKKYFNFGEGESMSADVPEGFTIADLLRHFSIPDGMVMFATLNGDKKDISTRICEGDKLVLIPPLSGG